jgi:hypothetical protein
MLCSVFGGYVIVDFSLNCVYSCYKWYDVDIFVYLHVPLISCPCYVFYDVVENIRCTVLSGCAIRKYCCEVAFVYVADFSCVLVG